MSTINVDQFATNLPSEMQGDLEQLRVLDAEIESLEEKLNAIRQQRNTIFHRLELYCESRAPIRRIPHELLTIVFQQYPEDQHDRNSALMLVCKAWHTIVMQTPGLWNEIRISLSQIEYLPGIWSYIHACLDHSGKLPLDIYIDTIGLYPRHPFDEVRELYDSDDHKYGGEILDWCRALELEDLENDSRNRESISACALFMVIAFLRGKGDEFAGRWRTLHIDNTDEYVYGTLPHLWETLSNDGLLSGLEYLEFLGSLAKPSGWEPEAIPNPNKLKGITTDMEFKFSSIVGSLPRLEHLILAHYRSGGHFIQAASDFSFASLMSLQLWIYLPDDLETAVHLPALQVLALSGPEHKKFIQRLKAPKLTHLSISATPPHEYECALNTVTNLHWYDPDIRRPNLLQDLFSLISLAPSLELLHTKEDFTSIGAFMVMMKKEGRTSADTTDDHTKWIFVIPRFF